MGYSRTAIARTFFALMLVWCFSRVGTEARQQKLPTREFFYAGGRYAGAPGSEVMTGQMYVEVLRPSRVTQRYPLVFFHGNWQTATNWMGTPDGRPGWADYFLDQGYVVYLIDQPARGRSPWHSSTNGMLSGLPPSTVEQRFTAPEVTRKWLQASTHTQWPGAAPNKGRMGDPVFDAFYASQVESLMDPVETQSLIQAAGTALLDKIGPAILLTHSQAGTFGWLIADARPKLVKGVLAIEPAGPPFENAVFDENPARPWGLTDIPLGFDPPATASSDLKSVRQQSSDRPGLAPCRQQVEPARQLPHLKGIPVLIVSSESSYHAAYDHCTARFLSQAGVSNTFIRLEDRGIHGNGHMMMLEKNNREVAALLHQWVSRNIK